MILKKYKATVYIAVTIIIVFIIDTFLLSTSAFTADHLVYGNDGCTTASREIGEGVEMAD